MSYLLPHEHLRSRDEQIERDYLKALEQSDQKRDDDLERRRDERDLTNLDGTL